MSLQVIGAGLGRTGTRSLKDALAILFDAPCYHMADVIARPADMPVWDAALDGTLPNWNDLFADFAAVVDWPAVVFWEELAEAYPDAVILMSVRSFDSWWDSASNTIFEITKRVEGPWREMLEKMFGRFTPDRADREACRAAFEAHYAAVRARAPAERLVIWQPGDGWAPICAALDLPVPDVPFPHLNTKTEYVDNIRRMDEARRSR
ncbi:MAG: sulfotransferase family protein [Pseudomonadota bacterium]